MNNMNNYKYTALLAAMALGMDNVGYSNFSRPKPNHDPTLVNEMMGNYIPNKCGGGKTFNKSIRSKFKKK